MEILDSIIEVLYKEENYWNICRQCQCKGYCCIGANVFVNADEWSKIKENIQYLLPNEKTELKNNIDKRKQCVFHTDEKCLIHNIRPENCRYTPYQAVVGRFNILKYSMVKIDPLTKTCKFKTVRKKISQEEGRLFEQQCFVSLPNYDTYTKYVSLNWLANSCLSNKKILHVSEWLKKEPLFTLYEKS